MNHCCWLTTIANVGLFSFDYLGLWLVSLTVIEIIFLSNLNDSLAVLDSLNRNESDGPM